jgi:hypothetical protein
VEVVSSPFIVYWLEFRASLILEIHMVRLFRGATPIPGLSLVSDIFFRLYLLYGAVIVFLMSILGVLFAVNQSKHVTLSVLVSLVLSVQLYQRGLQLSELIC